MKMGSCQPHSYDIYGTEAADNACHKEREAEEDGENS